MFNFFKKKLSESEFYISIKKKFSKNGRLIYPGSLLKRAASQFGNKIALECEDRILTYSELYKLSVLFSLKLKENGIKKRDKVIIYSGNSVEFYIAYFAVWQIGAVLIPLNFFLHDKELLYIIENSEAKAIYSSSKLKYNIDKLNLSDEIKVFTESDIFSNLDTKVNFSAFAVEELDENELALLLYTSGTTGKPKGVMLSSKNIMTNTLQDYARMYSTGFRDDESFFSVLPLFHVFAQNTCIWLPVLSGSKVIVVPRIERKAILNGLKKSPTIFLGFPALYGLLIMMKNAPLDSIRLFISGADAMPDKIRLGFALVYSRKICAGYGLTEASPVVGVNHDNEMGPTEQIGKPFQDIKFEIRDEDGNRVKSGEIGTLWIKGDNVMLGYYKADNVTREVLKDGWLNTGDMGYFSDDDYISITGRSKDLIIHKGFNIYPQEIENILLSHSNVYQAAVVGKADVDTGEIPVAYVATKDLSKAEDLALELKRYCADNLAKYKVPKKIICLEKLPLNATGKIDKKRLVLSDK